MLGWLKRLTSPDSAAASRVDRSAAQGIGMSRAYFALHEYLNARMTDVVTMSFREIEELVGFALPVSARRDSRWWRDEDLANAGHANAWLLARRSAVADIRAQTVEFWRTSLRPTHEERT